MAFRRSFEKEKWIWLPNYDDSTDPGKFVLFRRTFDLAEVPATEQMISVSADTRYRMLVNGHRAAFGPCKSYLSRWYYETVDIAPYLKAGKNVIAIRVLRFSAAHAGNSSIIKANIPGLILQGTVADIDVGTGAETSSAWKTVEDVSTSIVPRSKWNYALGPPFMSLSERCDQRLGEKGWAATDFDDRHWKTAVVRSARSLLMPMLEPRRLFRRPIPHLPEIESRFHNAVQCQGPVALEDFLDFIHNGKAVTLPANSTVVVELQAKILTTAFLRLECDSGPGCSIKIVYAESYENPIEITNSSGIGAKRWKGDRTNWKTGNLYGPDDEYITISGNNMYEPFWFSTFRFIRLTITTSDQPLTLMDINFRETHYPLEIETQVSGTSGSLEKMWEISLNTLRNCMHETYEDCPFYEQNQFAMDTRTQILLTYQISRDDRLARKTMQEFYSSRRDDGLVETHFPCPFRSINIPQFSLFWILMVNDHAKYFQDRALVRRYVGTVDGILDHFISRIGAKGMICRFDEEAWPFVDWVKEWHGNQGLQSMAIPPCYHKEDGIVAYNSLVLAMTLREAADLNGFIGRHGLAQEYRDRADALNAAVNQHCFNDSLRLYVDGPSTTDVCQHTQIFAILSGAINGVPAADLLRRTLEKPNLPKCSYAMSFYVLRAASKVGLYNELFPMLMRPWEKMIADNLTTWAEDDVMFRSDCHGWSASPIYEIVQEIFGVSRGGENQGGDYDGDMSRRVKIEPRFTLSESAKGTFVIKDGTIDLSWAKETGLVLTSSKDITVDVVIGGVLTSCAVAAKEQRVFECK